MENPEQIPSGDAMNNAVKDEKLNDKKPVGYGSSIQSDGNGRRNRPIDHDKVAAERANIEEEKKESDSELGHS